MSQIDQVFGHRHLGFWFRPLITLNDSGFRFRGKSYVWSNVVKVKEHDLSGINAGTAKYRARIELSDGTHLSLNCRALEIQGIRPMVDFWSTKTDAYEELMEKMRRAL